MYENHVLQRSEMYFVLKQVKVVLGEDQSIFHFHRMGGKYYLKGNGKRDKCY